MKISETIPMKLQKVNRITLPSKIVKIGCEIDVIFPDGKIYGITLNVKGIVEIQGIITVVEQLDRN